MVTQLRTQLATCPSPAAPFWQHQREIEELKHELTKRATYLSTAKGSLHESRRQVHEMEVGINNLLSDVMAEKKENHKLETQLAAQGAKRSVSLHLVMNVC